ncbi:ATP-binding protein [Actinophytocola gossypii]|uniref:Tetratricopeptide repeat protein n=1 Tax=Actinophytocola gossypii TaxID=2812003 RepID=A0ABT2J210_9PSEU|nr:tetratricopeptide repeat protein [Actinophytocola gossypii]MCT2581530.1 tetratricopeptide repeat protein [Actinophytocola gossypii]
MWDIFVSYRSADAPFGAAAIYELLATRFDRDRIFLDNQSISPGAEYPDRLSAALESMRVLLVLVGPRWLAPDPDEPDRLPIRDERDWVRQEIMRAFERSIRVVPVLFDGAGLPDPGALPAAVRPLLHCQAVEVSHLRLGADVARLAERLADVVPGLPPPRAGPARLVPRQLPPAPPWFVGRADELGQLGRPVTAIVGTGGIGKTWLALHWAHHNADRFPDGQLFVDLRGTSSAGRPMSTPTALRCLLDGLGVDHHAIPVDLDAQIGRYRSLVAGRRLLVVLDNADSATQVAPLLPGSPTCTVLVTSRNRLDGLLTSVGAHLLALDALTDTESHDLFLRRLGSVRLRAEPTAAAELVRYCSGLPLALGIVAGRVVNEEGLPLAVPAGELRDAATRIGALDAGDPGTSVTAVLSWSYDALTSVHARVFALLGLMPGPDFGLAAVACLAEVREPEARTAMRELERVSFVSRSRAGRWQLHDLVRLFAANRAEQTVPADEREAAVLRVVDHYLHTAQVADRKLDGNRRTVALDPPVRGSRVVEIADHATAMAWFTAEYASVRAAQEVAARHGWHRTVWRLAWVLHSFQWQQGHVRAQLATWRAALAAAEALHDPSALAVAHRLVGSATARAGRPQDAAFHLHRALELTAWLGDLRDHAHTRRALARLQERRADHEGALEHAVEAHRLYRELRLPANEADALDLMCWYEAKLGRDQAATRHGEAALALYRELGDRNGEATALDSLGHVAHRTGRHVEALDYYRRALALFRGTNVYHEADTLDRLGEVCAQLSYPDAARDAWERCLRLYRQQDRLDDAERVQWRLATLTRPEA